MSQRAKREGASLSSRIAVLILLPIIVGIIILLAVGTSVLLVVGGILDILQFVFFGTTGVVRWVGKQVAKIGGMVR